MRFAECQDIATRDEIYLGTLMSACREMGAGCDGVRGIARDFIPLEHHNNLLLIYTCSWTKLNSGIALLFNLLVLLI